MNRRIDLNEKDIPKQWYNIQADLPHPVPPPLNPGTGQPITPDMLAPVFPMNLIEQEVSTERWIPIPDEVLEKYLIWRPSPFTGHISWKNFLGLPPVFILKMKG